MKRFLILSGALFTFFATTAQVTETRAFTKGIYGLPGPLWENGYNLSDLGVNAVFVHSGSITHEMMERAKAEGMKR
jgi:hypothetical protein